MRYGNHKSGGGSRRSQNSGSGKEGKLPSQDIPAVLHEGDRIRTQSKPVR